jgi:hypothetical protein
MVLLDRNNTFHSFPPPFVYKFFQALLYIKLKKVWNWRFRYLKVFGLSGLGQGLYGPESVDDVSGLAEVDLVERAPDLVLHVLHQSACTKKT